MNNQKTRANVELTEDNSLKKSAIPGFDSKPSAKPGDLNSAQKIYTTQSQMPPPTSSDKKADKFVTPPPSHKPVDYDAEKRRQIQELESKVIEQEKRMLSINKQFNDKQLNNFMQPGHTLSQNSPQKEQQKSSKKAKKEYRIENTQLLDQEIKLPQQTLRYGDVINLTFDKDVKDYADNTGFYQGILYSNGVTKLNLDIMPKRYEDRHEAFINFKCCLFKIETCSSFEMNQKMEVLKQKRLTAEQERDLNLKKNESEDGKATDSTKDQLEKTTKQIKALQELLDYENRENKYLNEKIKGSKVLYGDLIVLKHLESEMYISLDKEEAAEENGCVSCKLMPLNESSQLTFKPADVLKQIGQIILYQDSFLIQNFIDTATATKQAQYIHTSIIKLQPRKDDTTFEKYQRKVLEVNGSSDSTPYKARLYHNFDFYEQMNEESKENIFSGDVIQIFHKQSGGYLTVETTNNKKRLKLKTRLKIEKQEFKNAEKLLIKKFREMNDQTNTEDHEEEIEDQNDDDKNDQNENQNNIDQNSKSQVIKKKDEKKKKVSQKPKIIIEIDPNENNKAKYLWEIQKLKPYVAKLVNQEDYYRIKHIQTGKYLNYYRVQDLLSQDDLQTDSNSQNTQAINSTKQAAQQDPNSEKRQADSEMGFELTLSKLKDQEKFLFQIVQDKKAEDTEEDQKRKRSVPIKDLNIIHIQTRDSNLKVQYVVPSQQDKLKKLNDQANSQQEQDNIIKNKVMCLSEPKDSQSRMKFQIQKAPTIQAILVRMAVNQSKSAYSYFEKLVDFAEEPWESFQEQTQLLQEQQSNLQKDYEEQKMQNPDNLLTIFSYDNDIISQKEDLIDQKELAIRLDKQYYETQASKYQASMQQDSKNKKDYYTKYSYRTAQQKESKLDKLTNSFKKNIINLKQTLRQLQESNQEDFKVLQNYLSEQGLVDVYVQMLDLINLKTTPRNKRYLYSRYKRYIEYYRQNESKFNKEEVSQYLQYIHNLDKENIKSIKKDDKAQMKDGTLGLRSSYENKQTNLMGKKIEKEKIYEEPYDIVKPIVQQIPGEILQIILLMITQNERVDKELDKYLSILFQQLLGENIQKAKKIFKVSYRLSRLTKTKGNHDSCKEINEKQLMSLKSLQRWIDLIIDPFYQSETQQNLKQQIIFFKVISLICQDKNNNGIYENQMLVFKKLLDKDSRMRTITFSLQELNGQFVPHIQFSIRGRNDQELKSDLELFFSQNFQLRLLMENKDEKSNQFMKQFKTPPFKMLQIFDPANGNNQDYSQYAKYLCSYLETIITCIRNGHKHAKEYPKKVGLSALFAIRVIEKTQSHKLKVILIKLLTHLFINNDVVYTDQYAIKNRCYYWDLIQNQQMHHKFLQFRTQKDIAAEDEKNQDQKKKKKVLSEQESKTFYDISIFVVKELKERENWDKQKKQVYKLLPEMIEKILMIDLMWTEESKEDYSDDIEWAQIDSNIKQRLVLIQAALQCSYELINCDKTSPVLMFKIIYASAIVFSWFKNGKNSENLNSNASLEDSKNQNENEVDFKNFRLYKLMQKARDAQKYKQQIQDVYTLLLQNLVIICQKRTNVQLMIILKNFQRKVSLEEPKNGMEFIRQKILQSIDMKSNGAIGLVKKDKEKQRFSGYIQKILSFEASGHTVLTPNFIDALKNQKEQEKCRLLNEFFTAQTKKGEKLIYQLKEMLLFLIFDIQLKSEIKNLAFEVLMLNFETVHTLKSEIDKVFFITSDEQKEYHELQQERFKILELAQDIVWQSYKNNMKSQKDKSSNTKEDKITLQNKVIKTKSSYSVKDLEAKIDNLVKKIKPNEKNFKMKQQMLRYLEFPKLLIDCILKNIYYVQTTHQNLFRLIMNFLYLYSQNNEENSKTLISQLDYLSSLQSIEIQNEKLITQIVKQLGSQEQETQLIDKIISQINKIDGNQNPYQLTLDKVSSNYVNESISIDTEIDNANNICSLLQSLILLAQDSIFNKGSIFNKILKLDKFYDYIKFSKSKHTKRNKDKKQQNNQSQNEKDDTILINSCVQSYRDFFQYVNEEKIQNYNEIDISSQIISEDFKKHWHSRLNYIIHRRIIFLLIQCSQDQDNSIPQIAKIIPLGTLIMVLSQDNTPYVLKKKYLRILYQTHISKFYDQMKQSSFKEGKQLREVFQKIVYNDLEDFPFALIYSIEKAEQDYKEEKLKQAQLLAIGKYLLKLGKVPITQEDESNLNQEFKAKYTNFADLPQETKKQAVFEVKEFLIQMYQEKQFLTNEQMKLLQVLNKYQKNQNSDNPNQALEFNDNNNEPVLSQQQYMKIEEYLSPSKTESADSKELSLSELKNLMESAKQEFITTRNKQREKEVDSQLPSIENYEPKELKYFNQNNPNEYWQYLLSSNNSIKYKDGLINFILDFFKNLKWDLSTEDRDLFTDHVQAPLLKLKGYCKTVISKNSSIIPGGEELLLKIDDALQAIDEAFRRQQEKQKGKQNKQDITSWNNKSMKGYLKFAENYPADTPLMITADPKTSFSKVELKKSLLKTSSVAPAKEKLGERIIRYLLRKQMEQNQITSRDEDADFRSTKGTGFGSVTPLRKTLVPEEQSRKLEWLHQDLQNQTKNQNYKNQSDEAEENYKFYCKMFCEHILKNKKSLKEVFKIQGKDFDSNFSLKQDAVIAILKEIINQEDDNNQKGLKFYNKAIQKQNQKREEDSEKQDDAKGQVDENQNEFFVGLFGEQLLSHFEEEEKGKGKQYQILEEFIRKDYQKESSQQAKLNREFMQQIKDLNIFGVLQPDEDLNGIIKVIKRTVSYFAILQFIQFQNKNKEKDMVSFFKNMILGLKIENQRFYILKLLKGILDKYLKKSQKVKGKTKEEVEENNMKFKLIIQIMKDCKLSEPLIEFLDTKESKELTKEQSKEVSFLSIKILILLLEGMALKMQNQLFEFIQKNQKNIKMAEFIKNHLEQLTSQVIDKKFNQIKDYSNAHIIKSLEDHKSNDFNAKKIGFLKTDSQEASILDEFEPEETHKKFKSLQTLQNERKQVIKEFRCLLRFIQLLCDNCHKKFQNYFRDQLTVQQNEEQQSQYRTQILEDAIENTSSFNIIVVVVKSFIKITENLRDLIFFDKVVIGQKDQQKNQQEKGAEKDSNKKKVDEEDEKEQDEGLSGLMQSFFEVILDFLYGPCLENQELLSGWQRFLVNVNFYFNCKDTYFFALSYSQECRFTLMFKASLLILGIIENPNTQVSRDILAKLEEGISLSNLQKIMISIHRQKIQGIPGSYDIFKTRRRFQVKDKGLMKKYKIYPENSMTESDEIIFEIGFNIFKFLHIAQRLNKSKSYLAVIKQDIKVQEHYERLIQEEKKDNIKRLLQEKILERDANVEFFRKQIIFLQNQNDIRVTKAPQKLIKIYKFILSRQARIHEEQKNQEMLATQAEIKVKLNSREYLSEMIKRGILQRLQRQAQGLQIQNGIKIPSQFDLKENEFQELMDSKYFKSFKEEFQSSKAIVVDQEENDTSIKNLVATFQEIEMEKIENSVKNSMKQSDEFQEGGLHSTKEYQPNQIEKQLDNYQLEKAINFYSEFTAEVEINFDGTLVRSIFKIPQKCAYLTEKTRESILYGQETSSLFDKLEALFAKMNILTEEMKGIQRLSRKNKLRYWISVSNQTFQWMSTVFIAIINLLYLVFYTYDEEDQYNHFHFVHIEQIVLALSFIQVGITFLIHLGYLEKYHSSYFTVYKESREIKKSNKISTFKGSLAFAEGSKVKEEHREIVETDMHNLRERYNRVKKQQNKTRTYLDKALYCLKIYFIGLNQDPIHAFNLLFFAFSIGAIYYPLLFSLLLLENILQIPLLFSVIQAIVNNRKQILLTLLLLLVIVYVYSFVAFMIFKDTYVTAEEDDSVPYNSYCSRLGYCFTSTLNNGVRSGGGIGDSLHQLQMGEDYYWGRYAFDLTFYIMIIVLLLNLIFGIIIDAFAEMRDKKKQVEKEVKERCFICGKQSSEFETKKRSFQDHIQKEHNVYAYIYYIFYISRKPMAECTGVERYVQEKIINEDPHFFPLERSLGLEEDAAENKNEKFNI